MTAFATHLPHGQARSYAHTYSHDNIITCIHDYKYQPWFITPDEQAMTIIHIEVRHSLQMRKVFSSHAGL